MPVRPIFLAAFILVCGSLAALTRIPERGALPAFACSIGEVYLDQAVWEADAAAVVYVESVRGPENDAPPVSRTPTGLGIPGSPLVAPNPPGVPRTFRTELIDLTGYGATLQVYEPVFGELPPRFDVDAGARLHMEGALRSLEAGFVPPCPPDIGAARYVPGQYYLVLLKKGPLGWGTALQYYRVEGPDLITMKVYEQESRYEPWRLEMRRPVYDRFFRDLPATLAWPPPEQDQRGAMPREPRPMATRVPTDDEVLHLQGPRIPLGPLVAGIRALRASGGIIPPRTGDGGLLSSSLR